MAIPLLLLLAILHLLALLPQPHAATPTRTHRQHSQSETIPSTPRHAPISPRGLLPDIANFASNTVGGLFGSSNSPPTLQNIRQVTYPQDFQPFPPGDSRALTNAQPNAPLPHPTQLPSASPGPPKSQPPPATSATSVKAQPTAHAHPASSSTSSSPAPSATLEPAPQSVFQRFGALYKPSNRFEPLAVLLTVVFILGFLVTLMSILKCVAHKKRFANKKDYPTGFPWVEPAGAPANRTSSRQGLVHTKSYTSTRRNSMTSSVHFTSGRARGPQGELAGGAQAEYQLHELGSDVYSNYAWAVTEMELEKNPASPSDDGPSSATTDETSHIYSPTREPDHWHSEGPCLVRGARPELLEDSKVFKLGHP